MDAVVLLPLALFVALLAAFIVVARGASILVARTRDHQRFQREIAELHTGIAATLDPLLARLDEVRHHRAAADTLLAGVADATTMLRESAGRAEAIRPSDGFADVPGLIADALARGERALGLVEHGTNALVSSRGGPRELEAQTSLKRGTLALRNIRAELRSVAERVAAAPPPPARHQVRSGHAGHPSSRRG